MPNESLRPQTKVREFVILRVLGQGSYGITYLATDTENDRSIAIKEYFPSRFATRGPKGIVNPKQPSPDDVEDFASGLTKFLEEAATLAGFHDDHIVQVFDWFEHNGTAYVVMRYEEGETLHRYLTKHKELIPESDLLEIFVPLLEGLRTVHAKWFLHRDIKPENIYLRRDGDPLLIDFGTARRAASAKYGGMTAYLTPGFAPPEQYDRRGEHGPWTDIYALGATMYYCVTRIVPYDGGDRYLSLMRSQVDPVIPATQAAPSMYSRDLLEVIDWMMTPDHGKRPQGVDEVLARLAVLTGHGRVSAGRAEAQKTDQKAAPETDQGSGQADAATEIVPAQPPSEAGEEERATEMPPTERAPTPAPTPGPAPRSTPPLETAPTPSPEPPAPPPPPATAAPATRQQQTAGDAARAVPGEHAEASATTRVETPGATQTPPRLRAGTGPQRAVGPRHRKRSLLPYGIGLAVVAALLVEGWIWWNRQSTPPPAPPVVETQPAPKPVEKATQPPAEEQPAEQQPVETEADRRAREQAEAEAEQRRQQQLQEEAERKAEAERQRQLELQREAERKRLAGLLDQCSTQLGSGPVTGPGGEQALVCYRGVLEQYPENETARRAIANIEQGFLDAIQVALDAGAPAKAASYIDKLNLLGLAQGRIAGLENEVQRRTPGETVNDALKDGGTGPAMVVVPAGSFTMGCAKAGACPQDQRPARTVAFAQPFLAGKYEVTFDDYDRFANATGRRLPDDLGWGRGQRPVINVTWNDAKAYASWLSDQTGHPYRLLSESEWEYIDRSGSDHTYFFGDRESQLCTYGNHADADSGVDWRNSLCSDGFPDRTAPVGHYSLNDWKISDSIGNVWEWVGDCWHSDYKGAPVGTDPWLQSGAGDCERRVIRGGSWYDGPEMLRPAVRNWAMAGEGYNVLGFRVAADVD